jgi:phosphoribosylglycinamide formyltransferase-1
MRSSGLGGDVQDAERGIPPRANIHDALLPKHGGRGKYGIHVHESVLASGDPETGLSIHLVDAEYDRRPVIAQCRVAVLNGDSLATLQGRAPGARE